MEEWDKPEIIETPVGLEINSYACAAMGDDEGDDADEDVAAAGGAPARPRRDPRPRPAPAQALRRGRRALPGPHRR